MLLHRRAVVAIGTVLSSFPETVELADGIGLADLVHKLSQSAGAMAKLTEAANDVSSVLKGRSAGKIKNT